MKSRYLGLTAISVAISSFIPLIVSITSLSLAQAPVSGSHGIFLAGLALAAVVVCTLMLVVKRRWGGVLTDMLVWQGNAIDNLPASQKVVALLVLAGLSLFLELAMIRWLASLYPFFSFYKNFVLLSCFMGLGVGYALSQDRSLGLPLVVPLMTWLMFLMPFVRNGMDPTLSMMVRSLIPFSDQLHLGVGSLAHHLPFFFSSHFFFTVVFLLTSLIFVPIGQACGRLMEYFPKLRGYGLNLLGSILGMLLMFVASFLWLPPFAWFTICFMGILAYQQFNRTVVIVGGLAATAGLVVLSIPWNPVVHEIYSPYQLIERVSSKTGFMRILAGGTSFQEVFDYSFNNTYSRQHRTVHGQADYYEFPYEVHRNPGKVLILGAGTGNDVAAGLRMGASQIDAVEIDPGIVALGRAYHPEKPYEDERVTVYINDARTFIRNTASKYDMVIFGLLDSHTVLSQASSVRVDSFVYTVESFREARRLLKPGGTMWVCFAVCVPEIAKKFYLMMEEAFDGRPPTCIAPAMIAQDLIYVQGEEKAPTIPVKLTQERGWRDVTDILASESIQSEPSTDDWPFLYMPRRTYPLSYIPMAFVVLALSVLLSAALLGVREQVRQSNAVFFLLGAGFMLVETKAITELGLTFGNTWEVIAIAILGVLIMAFFANHLVARFKIANVWSAYLFLGGSLLLGYYIATLGGLDSTSSGRLATVALLACPVFFSGIIFSALLPRGGNVSAIMAGNLLGAMFGGLLEYNSMYFGFRFLYLLALILYCGACLLGIITLPKRASSE